jgi:DNA-binding Xre family transcriptional regulator
MEEKMNMVVVRIDMLQSLWQCCIIYLLKGGGPMLTFGERIAVLRRRKGLTQQELAAQVGITQNTITRVETGMVKMLRGDTVAALAKALGTSADYLLSLCEEPDIASEGMPAGLALVTP